MSNLLIFDGDCGICTTTAEFIKKRSNESSLMVRPYQILNLSEIHKDLTSEKTSISVYFYQDNTSVVFSKSKAVFMALKQMNSIYKVMGYLLDNPFFVFISNPIYDIIAKNRTKISKFFGLNACKIDSYK
jgi:predicted DCC family thiol-disulfide oxidoreductase YuxK